MLNISPTLKQMYTNGATFQFTAKLQVLDRDDKVLAEFTDEIIDGRVTVDNSRPSLRDFQMRLVNTDGSLTWGPDKLVWLDKYFKVYIGVYTPQIITNTSTYTTQTQSDWQQGVLDDVEVI
jgi:hypothetical protein